MAPGPVFLSGAAIDDSWGVDDHADALHSHLNPLKLKAALQHFPQHPTLPRYSRAELLQLLFAQALHERKQRLGRAVPGNAQVYAYPAHQAHVYAPSTMQSADVPAVALQPNGSPEMTNAHLHQVLQALQAIYDPASTNDTRRAATQFLETAKQHPDAPAHGRTLALDRSQPAQLRHYGLTLLEHVIAYRWEDFTVQQGQALRACVVELAQSVQDDDPVYLRNKVAHLWTEVAKRSWGAEWMDMDAQMCELWRSSLPHQAVVVYVLETLSEEVFNREDAVAGLRGSDLGRACVEIFTPATVLAQQLGSREKSMGVRCGDEGWLARLCENVDVCLSQDDQGDERVRTCAVKSMNALRAAMPWVMPKAIAATHVIPHVCRALAVPVVELQLAAVDVIAAIYVRHALDDDEWDDLVAPLLTADSVRLLRDVYGWAVQDMDVRDLNEQKYTLCKKLAELANSLGLFIERRPSALRPDTDIPGFFSLMYTITSFPSLFVSIPVLHCFAKLLKSRCIRSDDIAALDQSIVPLLEICCRRLIRYESFPEDSEDVTILFLDEDVDTVPERHAFLGNYRRYCTDVVETVVRKVPGDAMAHILAQASNVLAHLYSDVPAFDAQNYSKSSMACLRVDAHVTIIEAALKGYLKWVSSMGSEPQKEARMRREMEDSFEQWCRQLLQLRFEDPEITKKIVQLLSTFSTKALPDRPAFALSFLEYLLTVKLADNTAFAQYSEAVKDLERMCSLEMQKLAMKFPDEFMNVYDNLERKINEMVASPETDDRQKQSFRAFLFIIIHRCSTLDRATQEIRMKEMLDQVKEGWNNPAFTSSMSSFDSFCNLLGMEHLPEFLVSNRFAEIQDWAEQPLPEEGQALQAAILERSNFLPLRLTKTLLAASTERLRDGSPAYELANALWADATPVILPNILQLVSHAHAFNNVDRNFSHLPSELQQVMRRILTDRFWQAGISTESREAFFARVSSSKSTFEGFASTVRGTIRQIRESSYYILYSLTRFRETFYGIPDLPEPLAQALFSNAASLSAHHLSVLLSVSVHLIEGCPAHRRKHFLPPLVEGLLRELGTKITTEWDAVNRLVQEGGENDDLTVEMKTESILRQLTFSSVSLVASLVDRRPEMRRDDNTSAPPTPGSAQYPAHDEPMSTFVAYTDAVLEPILLFCNVTLRVRDTRSVTTTIRSLRQLLPRARESEPVRAFFCNDILKSAISSLNESWSGDCQKDLASLIAAVILLDKEIPRSILLSLPGMSDDVARVDRKLERLRQAAAVPQAPGQGGPAQSASRADERLQRSIVLDLLGDLRGVSIHELGKVERARPKRSRFQEQYMQVDQGGEGAAIVRGGSPGLEGVAGMFEGGN